MVQFPVSTRARRYSATELAECGWRWETFVDPDDNIFDQQVPLTAAEFLHPQEGYHLPNSTFHDNTAGDAKDILTRRYSNQPDVGVFRDLLIEWDSDLGDHCPDTFVAFDIRNKSENRNKFIVVNEGTRPTFILEVVSPRYRQTDRETKVVEYARAKVQEYVIIDRRIVRRQLVDEVLGYRLMTGYYQPITPDEDGRILCNTLGVWISLQDGRLIIEDAQTGQRLMTSQELEAANQELEAANQELEAANQELETERNAAQQQAADMAALLDRYRLQFGDLPEGKQRDM
jgi:Uma2 family endonuclease